MTRAFRVSLLPMGLGVLVAGCGGGSGGATGPTPVNYGGPITSGQIVFVSTRGGVADLYRADANGANVSRLTNFAGTIFSNVERPCVSPDGLRIVFQFAQSFPANPNSNTDIGIVNTDGTGARALTDDRTLPKGPEDYAPAFSPTGDFIFWTSTRGSADYLNKVPHIWRMDGSVTNAGADQSQFVSTPSAYPSFDKGGTSLAYSTPGQTTSVAIQPVTGNAIAAGSSAKTIGSSAGDGVFDVALSPDGSRVAFSVASSGKAPVSDVQTPTNATLSILNTTNGSSLTTISSPTQPGGSAWSRDSGTLFFDANSGTVGGRQLFTSSGSFATNQLLTTSPQGASYSPTTRTGG